MMFKIIIFLFTISVFSSCTTINNTKDEEATPWKLLLDNKTYIAKQLIKYGRQPITFISTHQELGKAIDTSYISGTQINWELYVKPFAEASLYDSIYDRKYRVTQLVDSSSATVQLTYLPSFSNLEVQKMFIAIDEMDNKINNIYIERKKSEFFKTTYYKILYNPGKQIQLQTETKPLFGKKTYTIDQLIFMI